MDVPVWGLSLHLSIHLCVHCSKTGYFGGILISDMQTFQPDGYLDCFCDIQMYIDHFTLSGWTSL